MTGSHGALGRGMMVMMMRLEMRRVKTEYCQVDVKSMRAAKNRLLLIATVILVC